MKQLKLFFFAMLITGSTNLIAQQTYYYVPNSQVTGEGKYYIQLNSFLESNLNRVLLNGMYGVYKDTEIGISITNNSRDGSSNFWYGINAQHRLKLNEDHNLSFGGTYAFDSDSRGGYYVFALVTANKILPKANINAGLYYGNEILFGENAFGFMAGIDYPVINDKIRVKGEYMSGKHLRNGLNVGGQYEISKNMLAGIGINLINEIDNYNPVILQLHYNF